MLRLRPTFVIASQLSRSDTIAALQQAANAQGQSDLFRMHGEYGELHLPRDQHRVWSPHLSFYVNEDAKNEDGETARILGRFAPRVDVWTSIWIFYLLMAFSAFFGFTLAYSQWALGNSAWGIWIGIVPLLLILTLHIIANVGQTWSADQMHTLREQLEALVAEIQSDTNT